MRRELERAEEPKQETPEEAKARRLAAEEEAAKIAAEEEVARLQEQRKQRAAAAKERQERRAGHDDADSQGGYSDDSDSEEPEPQDAAEPELEAEPEQEPEQEPERESGAGTEVTPKTEAPKEALKDDAIEDDEPAVVADDDAALPTVDGDSPVQTQAVAVRPLHLPRSSPLLRGCGSLSIVCCACLRPLSRGRTNALPPRYDSKQLARNPTQSHC